jgi:hypothetical protein
VAGVERAALTLVGGGEAVYHMWYDANSCDRPSEVSTTGVAGSTSTIGNRRRAAAIASPSRVCAFSRTRCPSICFCQVYSHEA